MLSVLLAKDQEKALVKYVQRLEEAGFPPTAKSIRQLAFSFAEKNCVPHRFNRDTKLAAYDWLQLFLKRHPELTVRNAQGLFIARGL